MKTYKIKQTNHGIFLRYLCVFVTVLSLVLVVYFVSPYSKTEVSSPVSQPEINTQSKHGPTSATGRYLFNGTIFWGRGIEEWSRRPDRSLDYAHPFSGLGSFSPENYDAWVADLECPITSQNISFADQISTLVFNCRPEYLVEAAKYFQVMNLANNHTDNRGAEGLSQTREQLTKTGVQYVGHYDPSVESDACEVIALPIRLQYEDKNESKATMPVALCAWHYFYREPLGGELEVIKRYAGLMPVFSFVHMGGEYYAKANDLQRNIAHKVVELGSEFVIANNPHWVQDSEVYRGKLIVYSTGNFIFDQLDYETQRSASIDVTMKLDYDENVAGWLELGPSCLAYQDNCLAQANAKGLKKPKLQLSFGVVAGDSSNKLTKRGSPELQKAIEERLNWTDTLQKLD